MVKWGAVTCIVLLLCACASSGTEEARHIVPESGDMHESSQLNHWITMPRQNELVILGVSGLQTSREAEIATAREFAARRVSMYHGVQVQVEANQRIGGFLEHAVNSTITVTYSQEIDQYLERLAFDPDSDVFTRNNAVFVRFTYPSSSPGTIQYSFGKNLNGSPQWTTNPPDKINNFMAGVGFSRRQARIRDTIARSTESAIAAIVSRISSEAQASEIDTFTRSATTINAQSRGRLSHFVVLETWIDSNTEAVWTLAVAQNAD